MNKKTSPAFAIIISFFGFFVLSACVTDEVLAGSAGVADETTPTISILPTSEVTATPVPTETPVPMPTLGIGSTVTSGDMSMA